MSLANYLTPAVVAGTSADSTAATALSAAVALTAAIFLALDIFGFLGEDA
jgi:hypothetical protein